MIQANELRIGNFVKPISPRHNEKYIKVESVSCEEINSEFRPYSSIDLNPIELTEEILLKCGFNKNGSEWSKDDFCMQIFQGWLHYSGGEGVKLSEEIKMLHELQNLYFAITKKELEIELF